MLHKIFTKDRKKFDNNYRYIDESKCQKGFCQVEIREKKAKKQKKIYKFLKTLLFFSLYFHK